eukprot:364801-Chlamydomonas_euryale.AAC.7
MGKQDRSTGWAGGANGRGSEGACRSDAAAAARCCLSDQAAVTGNPPRLRSPRRPLSTPRL